ncbi:MAG: PilZ domain-containing protein, partial [Bdellovibrionales bacterium]|nr:PilZ domain-containing protein [Bdellovibrionales bacterium]
YNYINNPLVDLNYYNELFVNKLKLSLDIKERRKIESIIKQNHTNRSNPRVDVDAGAKAKLKGSSLKQKEIDFNIKDVSRNGFRAFTSEAFPLSSNLLFNIKLADTITAKVQAKAVWVSADFGVGFEILNADKEWNRFIDFLYRNQLKKVG